MEKNINKKTVFVGISGGVDSSVSAALLKNQGHDVVGVFIRTWSPDFINCTWRDERRDAMRVCAHLGIPFLECNAEKEYKKDVADYMINEYKKGRTPNPDVMCNREIKFGVFWSFAKSRGADYIATGHYAICEKKNNFREATGGGVPSRGNPRDGVKELREKLFFLKQNKDKNKDQSYFLWTLTQEDLSHTLFPIGHLKKDEVRKLAEKYKLPTATKKDSQGVCFLGKLNMKDFLKHYIKEKRGDILDENGKKIGDHDGAMFFTIGERHGFHVFDKNKKNKPYYVTAKDIKNNTITVSTNPTFYKKEFTPTPTLALSRGEGKGEGYINRTGNFSIITSVNWINDVPKENKRYKCQIRYHGELLGCKIKILKDKKAEIIFDKNILVDSGQSIVVYEGDVCLGGGIVE